MKKIIILLVMVLFLVGCNDEAPEPAPVKADYSLTFSVLKTKEYDIKREYVQNAPVHTTEIEDYTNLNVYFDEGAAIKVNGIKLKEVSPGTYAASNIEDNFMDVPSIDMQRGEYTITVDVDNDGEIDGQQKFAMPGTELAKPQHGAKLSTDGFDIEWNTFGDFKDYQYSYSMFNGGDGYCKGRTSLDEIINPKNIPEPKHQIKEEIQDGLYLLMFKTIDNIYDTNEDEVRITGSLQEIVEMRLVVGDICQCCNPFEPPCDPDLQYPHCN